MQRKPTKEIKIGKTAIGGNNSIAIQSMTNTRTRDLETTVAQICRLEEVGCEIVRVAVLNREDAEALKEIKKQIKIPLVADIHFDYRLALLALAAGADKLRINPGNIGDRERIKAVVDACREKRVPIRIGVNAGSLEKDILEKHGSPTAEALVESAERHVRILEELDFQEIVISLKASDVERTVRAYELASERFPYPLHIGVTEAGSLRAGTIRSSIGLGILLHKGIGDTIRVSLSADPTEEVKVAKAILADLNLYEKPLLVSCPTCGRIQFDMLPIVEEIEDYLETLGNRKLKVAIMGCAVNGPGEAAEADIGIAGGRNGALLFKKGKIIRRIEEKDITTELKKEIAAMIE